MESSGCGLVLGQCSGRMAVSCESGRRIIARTGAREGSDEQAERKWVAMPLTKSKGNMYAGWVTHCHSHLGGECSHRCSYCYVQAMERRFHGGRYAGEPRLIEKEFDVKYGTGRTIFIEHCNDLFADDVQAVWIDRILAHCRKWPENIYVFQTKNPGRYEWWLAKMPPRRLLGCTIETMNGPRAGAVSKAPTPLKRFTAMKAVSEMGEHTFITIEPILKGCMVVLANAIAKISPDFVNIGADSKGIGLAEPSGDEVRDLIRRLGLFGVTVKAKSNLDRLLRSEKQSKQEGGER